MGRKPPGHNLWALPLGVCSVRGGDGKHPTGDGLPCPLKNACDNNQVQHDAIQPSHYPNGGGRGSHWRQDCPRHWKGVQPRPDRKTKGCLWCPQCPADPSHLVCHPSNKMKKLRHIPCLHCKGHQHVVPLAPHRPQQTHLPRGQIL